MIRTARPDDAGKIARVHVAAWRETYPKIVPESYLYTFSEERFEESWQKRLSGRGQAGIFVCEVAGEVVGLAASGEPEKVVDGFDGYLAALYLLSGAQGRGMGRRLFEAVAAHLSGKGCGSMFLWVMSENHSARTFYESLGGEIVEESSFVVEGERIEEIAHGWRSLPERG